MPEDNLDKFPTLGICVGCGAQIKYSPVRMPLGRPHINADRPGHFSIEYAPMCVPCIRSQIDELLKKINAGEMYPLNTWEASEDGNSFHIVPTMQSSSSEEVEAESPKPEPEKGKPGFFRRLLRWIY